MIDWPKKRYWNSVWNRLDKSYDLLEKAWDDALCVPENEVFEELNIYSQPIMRGKDSIMVIHTRKGKYTMDYDEWAHAEVKMAHHCKTAAEYKAEFKKFVLLMMEG